MFHFYLTDSLLFPESKKSISSFDQLANMSISKLLNLLLTIMTLQYVCTLQISSSNSKLSIKKPQTHNTFPPTLPSLHSSLLHSSLLHSSLHSIQSSTSTTLYSNPSTPPPASPNCLDTTLARLTSLFPFFVLLSAVLGYLSPPSLAWFGKNDGVITAALGGIMVGMGMTLTREDFKRGG